jgi:hypothetical protein
MFSFYVFQAPEAQARAIEFSVNTLKAFGNAGHVLSVAEYRGENVESRVQLVASSPILIDAGDKCDLEALFKSSRTTSAVFKSILRCLVTDSKEWVLDTGKFVKRNEAAITAGLAFHRNGRPDPSYGESQWRATIRHSLSDTRKKNKKGTSS